jgi:hypothetical protein
MALLRKPFFYSAQVKRMLVQLMACFAGYQVITGNQRDGKHRFLDVPIIYGDMQRTVGYILQGGSENVVPYIPMMSLLMTGMRQKNEWRQAPQHWERLNVIERARDADGNLLINVPGRKKSVERFQPVPYEMSFEVSIWASNNDQQLQLLEQIWAVYNPDMDIALSNSLADWTFLTSIIYDGDTNFERVAPQGTDIDALFVATLPFTVTIWISVPAKVYDTKYIFTINVPILDLDSAGDIIKKGEVPFDDLQQIDGLVIKADEEDIIAFSSFN